MTSAEKRACERLVLCLRQVLRSRAAARAGALLGCLAQMKDPRRAALFLGDWLRPLPPESITAVLQAIIDGAERKDPGSGLAIEAMLCPAMRSTWESGLSFQVQAVARKEGKYDLAAILLELPEMDARFAPPAGRLPKELVDVPLGVRKAWARKTDIYILERLLSDTDRAVIANLLDNPRLMLRDVIRLASKEDVREEILEEITQHPRWISQYPVKVTLAHNPSTPVRIALGLLRLLMSTDLKELVDSGRVSEVIAQRAGRMLRERQLRPGR